MAKLYDPSTNACHSYHLIIAGNELSHTNANNSSQKSVTYGANKFTLTSVK